MPCVVWRHLHLLYLSSPFLRFLLSSPPPPLYNIQVSSSGTKSTSLALLFTFLIWLRIIFVLEFSIYRENCSLEVSEQSAIVKSHTVCVLYPLVQGFARYLAVSSV